MVYKPEVLDKVIFPAECGSPPLVLAGSVIMRHQMLSVGIEYVAVRAMDSPRVGGDHPAAERSASPALEVEME